jgi:hypothetical protein
MPANIPVGIGPSRSAMPILGMEWAKAFMNIEISGACFGELITSFMNCSV